MILRTYNEACDYPWQTERPQSRRSKPMANDKDKPKPKPVRPKPNSGSQKPPK